MKLKISEIKNILNKGRFLTKIPKILAQRFLLSCLFLFFCSLILSGIVFYRYIILPQKVEPEVFPRSSLIKENIYREVLMVWEKESAKFNEADSKEYIDPFKTLIQTTKEEE